MANENAMNSGGADSQAASSVGQTANMGRSTSVAGGASKVFREFKWGLLTLFLLMVVVIGLVYDGGRKKKSAELGDPAKSAQVNPDINIDPVDAPPGVVGAAVPTNGAPSPTMDAPPPVSPPTTTHNVPPVTENNEPMVAMPLAPPPPAPPAKPIDTTPSDLRHPTGLGEATAPKNSKKEKNDHTAKKLDETEREVVKPKDAPKASGSEKTYVVQAGDTLTKIANRELPGKGNVKAILEANKSVLSDANKLRVGMTLKIPAALPASETAAKKKGGKDAEHTTSNIVAENNDKLETTKTEKPSKTDKKSAVDADATVGGDQYIVQSGDTLERIARKVLNDGRKWRSLYEWNRDQLSSPSQLRVGQTLKIKESAAVKPASFKTSRAEADSKDETIPAAMASRETVKPEVDEPTGNDVQACSTSASLP